VNTFRPAPWSEERTVASTVAEDWSAFGPPSWSAPGVPVGVASLPSCAGSGVVAAPEVVVSLEAGV
jgi:hypothetical protein